MKRTLLAAVVVVLALALPAQAKKKAKHTNADYVDGWLEQWNTESWGPNVYHDRQADTTCYTSDDPHELPDCEKDIPEWQVRIGDNYYEVGVGDTTYLSSDEMAGGIDPITDAEFSCRAVAEGNGPILRKTITLEVEREESSKKGQLTFAGCATKIRCRLVLGATKTVTADDGTPVAIVNATLYVPLYNKKGRIVAEASYNVLESDFPKFYPTDFLDLWK